MEEKKLTDEEIAKAILQSIEYSKTITYFDEWGNCKAIMITDIIDLIHRLQAEKESLKKDYIELDLECRDLRTELDNISQTLAKELAEHEEFTKKAKAEIERLTEWKDKLQDTKDELEQQLIDTGFKEYCEENAELRKQVDELKEERENMQAVIFGLEEDKRLLQKQVDELKEKLWKSKQDMMTYHSKTVAEAVKDTAKDIWNDITSYYFSLRVIGNATVELDKLAEFWHKRGVEVE
jgi:chromosome segregation ATPase